MTGALIRRETWTQTHTQGGGHVQMKTETETVQQVKDHRRLPKPPESRRGAWKESSSQHSEGTNPGTQ